MNQALRNRQWIFARRPEGQLGVEHFEMRETASPAPGPGQVLVRVRAASIDPAQRAWILTETYRARLEPGEMMPSFGLAEVVESNTPGLKPGDIVEGNFGWQDYAVANPRHVMRRDATQALEHLIHLLGITGLTAYFGLLEVGRPRPGETVLVSAAGGAVGTLAAQIAKIGGCRVVGVAGGAEKCRWLTEELGLDAAVDYKAGGLREAMKAACPQGIDVYFDNTAGEILDSALSLMNQHGRVVCCGYVSQYDHAEPGGGGPLGVPGTLIAKRIRMEGFLALDFDKNRKSAEAALANWVKTGALKAPVHVVNGLENAPQALIDLLAGRNLGKMMVRVS
ncbi:MAG: NADP-dependent oxidoreductase [Sulfuricaulis sp.]|nr:NADP-dependent oxidoreductase [Sulfuricaulis sp.]